MSLMLFVQLAIQPCADPVPCKPTPPPCHPNLVVEVIDSSKQPIPGAVVTAKAEGSKEGKKKLSTGMDGLAQFCLVGGASYDVRVVLEGFKKRRVHSPRVPASVYSDPGVHMKLELEVGAVFETVE